MAPLATARTFRLSESHLVFPVWQIIKDTPDTVPVDFARISKSLAKTRAISDVEVMDLLEQLTVDGLVIQDCTGKSPIFSLPQLKRGTVKQRWDILGSRDCYCYECHGPGEVWLCCKCPRVFHPDCVRPVTEVDLPLLPLREPVPDVVQDTFRQVYGFPYTKYRNGNTTPYPMSGDQDERTAEFQRTCINCRIRNDNKLVVRDGSRLPQLLDSAFRRIRSWINADTFSEQEPKSIHIPMEYIDILGQVLFQKLITADDIKSKIDARVYTSLVEFQCDIMDMVHCIGVLRGVNCAEFEAAKYLLLDSLHEIIEISNCADCYAHSALQDKKNWFVTPCQPPHELVYAKQTGFSYWPAKVIRRTANRVDVRFFGQQHTRAVINLRNVKPIDKMPAVKRSAKFNKAMAELAQHRELLKKPPTTTKPLVVQHKPSTEKELFHEALVKKRRQASDAAQSEDTLLGQAIAILEDESSPASKKERLSQITDDNDCSSGAYSDYQLSNAEALRHIDNMIPTEDSNDGESQTTETPCSEIGSIIVRSKDVSMNSNPSIIDIEMDDFRLENSVSPTNDIQLDAIPSGSEPKVEDIPSESKPAVSQEAATTDHEDIVCESNVDVQIEETPSSSELNDSSSNVFTDDRSDKDAPATSTPITIKAATNDRHNSSTETIALAPVAENLTDHRNGLDKSSVDASPPSIGTPIDFQKYSTNLEIAMLGCPQQFVDLAMVEFQKYVTAVQSEMAIRAEELIDAKVRHFCCICYQKANFYCCINTSYCSAACQSLDWIKGHRQLCERAKSKNSSTQTD